MQLSLNGYDCKSQAIFNIFLQRENTMPCVQTLNLPISVVHFVCLKANVPHGVCACFPKAM